MRTHKFSVKLPLILYGSTVFSLFLLTVLMLASESSPSLSSLISSTPAAGITFTIILFVHSYGVFAYLITVSDYYSGHASYSLMWWTCVAYMCLLVVISYLPTDRFSDPHSAVAILTFVVALCSVVSGAMSFHPAHIIDILIALVVLVSGAVFFWSGNAIAEYFMLAVLLSDKLIKIRVLEWYDLIDTSVAQLEYNMHSSTSPLERERARVTQGLI